MLTEATAPPCNQLLRAVDGLIAPPPGALDWLRTCLSPWATPPTWADARPFDFVDAAKRALPLIGALPPPPANQALFWCETVLASAIRSALNGTDESRRCSTSAWFAKGLIDELGFVVLSGVSPKSAARADRMARQSGMDSYEAQRMLLGVDERQICRRLADAWGLEQFQKDDIGWPCDGRRPSTPRGDAGRYILDHHISDRDQPANELVRQRMNDIRAALDLVEFARRWTAGGLNWDDAYADSSAIEGGQTAFVNRDFAQGLAEHLDSLPRSASAARCCRTSAAWFRGATDSSAAICAIRSPGGLEAATDRLILSPRRVDRTGLGGPRCEWIARILAEKQFDSGVTQALGRIGRRILDDAGIGLDLPVWFVRFGAERELTGVVGLVGPSPRAIKSVTQQARVVTALLRRTYEVVTVGRPAVRCADFADGPPDLTRNRVARSPGSATDILSRMAAGAAHELNNPLAVISGRAQMLLSNTAEGDDARALRTINEQVQRASGMVNELIEAAKPAAPDAEPILMGDWVERMRQYWRSLPGEAEASFQACLSDSSVRIWADPDQLDVVSREILDNARHHAKSENVQLTINSTFTQSDETIVLSVSDDGQGMTPETAAHACDPFYSQREAGRGRGLGLTRALRLVEVNGGRLWIESRRGVGTTVHIALASMASRPRKVHRIS